MNKRPLNRFETKEIAPKEGHVPENYEISTRIKINKIEILLLLMNIFYTHFIPMFCVLFYSFFYINKLSNALNVYFCD